MEIQDWIMYIWSSTFKRYTGKKSRQKKTTETSFFPEISIEPIWLFALTFVRKNKQSNLYRKFLQCCHISFVKDRQKWQIAPPFQEYHRHTFLRLFPYYFILIYIFLYLNIHISAKFTRIPWRTAISCLPPQQVFCTAGHIRETWRWIPPSGHSEFSLNQFDYLPC